jgi:chemotaxis protein MotB
MARKKKAAGKDNAERWLLTYADLITLLMVFFVLLFAMSNTDAKKFQELAGSLRRAFNVNVLQGAQPVALTSSSGANNAVIQLEQTDYQRIQQIIQQVEQNTQVDPQQVSAQITKEGIAVTVSGALLFYNGTNQIKPDGIKLLDQIGAYISTLPNSVRVEGHTDDIPVSSAQYPTNWELSSARAVAVVRFFSSTTNVAPNRLSAVGFGQYQPIVANDTRAHREQNRRAVIVILYGPSTAAGVTPTPGP